MNDVLWAALIVLILCLVVSFWMLAFTAALFFAGAITVFFLPFFMKGFIDGVRSRNE
jgi:predicted histidine transporter YuiF (NhaC family)